MAWLFLNRLNQGDNLFSISGIQSSYNTYTYVCHFSKVTNIIGDSITDYKRSCGNSTFFDVDDARADFYKFYVDYYYYKDIKIEFEPFYKIAILDNKVQAVCLLT